jgi:hypothetical protein
MIGLLIYLVGSVLAYRRMRKTWFNKHLGDDWLRICVCLYCALVSWVGVFVAFALDNKVKPPKWL